MLPHAARAVNDTVVRFNRAGAVDSRLRGNDVGGCGNDAGGRVAQFRLSLHYGACPELPNVGSVANHQSASPASCTRRVIRSKSISSPRTGIWTVKFSSCV